MKKIIALFIFGLLLVGFGCQKNAPGVEVPNGWTTYKSADYGFSVAYPDNMEMRSRATDQQDSSYVGLTGKFFASLRDVKREATPVSVAALYAFKDVTVDQFTEALKASDPNNITIKETTDLSQGGLSIKKIINTTALGVDKTHYVFLSGDKLVVVSVFLQEDESFTPLLTSVQVLAE